MTDWPNTIPAMGTVKGSGDVTPIYIRQRAEKLIDDLIEDGWLSPSQRCDLEFRIRNEISDAYGRGVRDGIVMASRPGDAA